MAFHLQFHLTNRLSTSNLIVNIIEVIYDWTLYWEPWLITEEHWQNILHDKVCEKVRPSMEYEKCPSMEFFLVRIFPQFDWIRRDTKYWVRIRENRTRKDPVFGNFSRSVLHYNLQFRSPSINSLLMPWNYNPNAIYTAIIRSSRLVVFCKAGVLTNFTKFTRKHLHQSLLLKEAADL